MTGSMSISAIITVSSFTTEWQAVVAKADTAYRLHRASSTNFCSFGRNYSGGAIDATNNVNVNDGNYHHVFGRFDTASGSQLFTDGTSGALNTNTSATTTNSDPLCIGRNTAFVPTRDWNGNIAEVRVYNQSKSDAWIIAEYNAMMKCSLFISADFVNNVDFSEIGCNF
jgi:hypothetical protein